METDELVTVVRESIFDVIWPVTEWDSEYACRAVTEAAAQAAIAAARPAIVGWRPIETAPRDGTEIDVWIDGEFPHRRTDVQWREPTESEWWVHGGDTIETPEATWHDPFGPLGKAEPPTHWQPLPEAPTAIRAMRGEG